MGNPIFKKISEYIIDQVAENSESSMSGFQYCVTDSEIQEMFAVDIENYINEKILEELDKREEVADVQLDTDGFDVVLYTKYAPNYIDEEE